MVEKGLDSKGQWSQESEKATAYDHQLTMVRSACVTEIHHNFRFTSRVNLHLPIVEN